MPDDRNNPQSGKPEDPRAKIREQRAQRLRVIARGKNTTVKVFATSEVLRSAMRHPKGVGFRDDIGQSVEWPNDNFTKRRLADGSVSLEAVSGEPPEPDETQNAREQAMARREFVQQKPAEQQSQQRQPQQRQPQQRQPHEPPTAA
jgi:hypothetical protein